MDAVFELRIREEGRHLGKQQNEYIAVPPKIVENDDESDPEDVYIRPKDLPYQLKHCYSIIDKQETVFEDDDEDNLIFAKQPFDTVLNIGYEDLLTHLPTKFLARRSDIIVSSTLSITLTPQDDMYEKKKMANITVDEIDNWIDKRNKYRETSIWNARMPEHRAVAEGITT